MQRNQYTLTFLSLEIISNQNLKKGKVNKWARIRHDYTIIIFTVEMLKNLKSYTYTYLKWDYRIRILKFKAIKLK